HGLADAADLLLWGMPGQADPGPGRDPGTAERGVGDLQGDRGDVAPSEDVRRGCSEDLRPVLPLGYALKKRGKGGSVGGEGVRGPAGPGQAAGVEGEHLAGVSLAQRGPAGAALGSGALGAQDAHLLVSGV